ncbi:hypothetical protein ADUPG1_000262 [Aduncisulcus paluster]|uniref:Uncharacterized protein n=1 Tax=Aduncisulcus paluster TaxID=2918883 RepID=A0ABQ5K651_9EUKA|nr:hypothetical protein ADUPG1_000262 [Aduncisulcus paluster]
MQEQLIEGVDKEDIAIVCSKTTLSNVVKACHARAELSLCANPSCRFVLETTIPHKLISAAKKEKRLSYSLPSLLFCSHKCYINFMRVIAAVFQPSKPQDPAETPKDSSKIHNHSNTSNTTYVSPRRIFTSDSALVSNPSKHVKLTTSSMMVPMKKRKKKTHSLKPKRQTKSPSIKRLHSSSSSSLLVYKGEIKAGKLQKKKPKEPLIVSPHVVSTGAQKKPPNMESRPVSENTNPIIPDPGFKLAIQDAQRIKHSELLSVRSSTHETSDKAATDIPKPSHSEYLDNIDPVGRRTDTIGSNGFSQSGSGSHLFRKGKKRGKISSTSTPMEPLSATSEAELHRRYSSQSLLSSAHSLAPQSFVSQFPHAPFTATILSMLPLHLRLQRWLLSGGVCSHDPVQGSAFSFERKSSSARKSKINTEKKHTISIGYSDKRVVSEDNIKNPEPPVNPTDSIVKTSTPKEQIVEMKEQRDAKLLKKMKLESEREKQLQQESKMTESSSFAKSHESHRSLVASNSVTGSNERVRKEVHVLSSSEKATKRKQHPIVPGHSSSSGHAKKLQEQDLDEDKDQESSSSSGVPFLKVILRGHSPIPFRRKSEDNDSISVTRIGPSPKYRGTPGESHPLDHSKEHHHSSSSSGGDEYQFTLKDGTISSTPGPNPFHPHHSLAGTGYGGVSASVDSSALRNPISSSVPPNNITYRSQELSIKSQYMTRPQSRSMSFESQPSWGNIQRFDKPHAQQGVDGTVDKGSVKGSPFGSLTGIPPKPQDGGRRFSGDGSEGSKRKSVSFGPVEDIDGQDEEDERHQLGSHDIDAHEEERKRELDAREEERIRFREQDRDQNMFGRASQMDMSSPGSLPPIPVVRPNPQQGRTVAILTPGSSNNVITASDIGKNAMLVSVSEEEGDLDSPHSVKTRSTTFSSEYDDHDGYDEKKSSSAFQHICIDGVRTMKGRKDIQQQQAGQERPSLGQESEKGFKEALGADRGHVSGDVNDSRRNVMFALDDSEDGSDPMEELSASVSSHISSSIEDDMPMGHDILLISKEARENNQNQNLTVDPPVLLEKDDLFDQYTPTPVQTRFSIEEQQEEDIGGKCHGYDEEDHHESGSHHFQGREKDGDDLEQGRQDQNDENPGDNGMVVTVERSVDAENEEKSVRFSDAVSDVRRGSCLSVTFDLADEEKEHSDNNEEKSVRFSDAVSDVRRGSCLSVTFDLADEEKEHSDNVSHREAISARSDRSKDTLSPKYADIQRSWSEEKMLTDENNKGGSGKSVKMPTMKSTKGSGMVSGTTSDQQQESRVSSPYSHESEFSDPHHMYTPRTHSLSYHYPFQPFSTPQTVPLGIHSNQTSYSAFYSGDWKSFHHTPLHSPGIASARSLNSLPSFPPPDQDPHEDRQAEASRTHGSGSEFTYPQQHVNSRGVNSPNLLDEEESFSSDDSQPVLLSSLSGISHTQSYKSLPADIPQSGIQPNNPMFSSLPAPIVLDRALVLSQSLIEGVSCMYEGIKDNVKHSGFPGSVVVSPHMTAPILLCSLDPTILSLLLALRLAPIPLPVSLGEYRDVGVIFGLAALWIEVFERMEWIGAFDDRKSVSGHSKKGKGSKHSESEKGMKLTSKQSKGSSSESRKGRIKDNSPSQISPKTDKFGSSIDVLALLTTHTRHLPWLRNLKLHEALALVKIIIVGYFKVKSGKI